MTFTSSHIRILLIAIALVYALLNAAPAAATGWHSAPIMVKPPVVVAPPPPAPVVVTPPPPATAAAPASTPAQQPSGGGGGSGFNPGYLVMAGVVIYFGAVIRSHWLWCAEDDRKPARERKCYRPLRDGMP